MKKINTLKINAFQTIVNTTTEKIRIQRESTILVMVNIAGVYFLRCDIRISETWYTVSQKRYMSPQMYISSVIMQTVE